MSIFHSHKWHIAKLKTVKTFPGLLFGAQKLGLFLSKPPAPLNACVIRGVFFYLKMIKRSLPPALLNASGNLLRKSGVFFMSEIAVIKNTKCRSLNHTMVPSVKRISLS